MTSKFSQQCVWLATAINRCVSRSTLTIAAYTWGLPMLAASVLITGLLLGVRLEGLQLLELAAFDQMVRLQPDAGPDPRLLVVAITEADIAAQKQWPLPDQTVAQLLAKLEQYQPKVIGLDQYRNIPQPPGQAALRSQLQAANVIVITKLSDTDTEGVPPLAGVPEERIGFNDFVVDPDGVIRRNFMYAAQGQDKFYAFSLRLSLNYLADQGISLQVEPDALRLGKAIFKPLAANSGGYQAIDALGYQTLLSYRSAKQVARQVTLSQTLAGLNPAWVKDKVVLIGTTAPSLKDTFFTPYSATERAPGMPGVLLHAQLVSQILSTVLDQQPLFWFWPQWGEALWIWAWSLVGGILAWRLQHPLFLGLAGSIALGTLLGVCLLTFSQAGWIPLIPSALGLVASGGSIVAYKLFCSAFHDPLTGLPNRALFLKRLQRTIAQSAGTASSGPKRRSDLFAVLFIDINRFKVVNDSLGHRTGDQLLVKATSRLKARLRRTDTLARVGGDEFAILLKGISNTREATGVADKLHREMALPFGVNGQKIFTGVSIGIALNRAEQKHQPEELLQDAHTALYRAKALGKARHEVFATGMQVQVKRMLLETDLRRALEQQEFQLYYQPIVLLQGGYPGRIAGFEALVRWQHPQHGLVSPADFIPVTEETELIIPLGQWILQEACRQLYTWQAQFPETGAAPHLPGGSSEAAPLMISVNLSPQQFSQPDLVESVEQILQTTGLDSRSLKLEITESVAMNDVESTITLLLRLRALNLRLSIDDFGTGYSSLSYLRRFPVNTLKIDRSFVSQMGDTSEDAAIVQTIILLAHNLGMDVIAEGIETAAQRAKLQALNCEYGQGFFFSKPLPSKAATALLATEPQW